jgi:hypothetical protein
VPGPQSRHRLECAIATGTSEPGPSNWRRRAPEDVASGSQSAPRAHPRTGATIPGTGRRPGQTGGRARGPNVSTASDPTPASSTKNYHTPTPFSSYRVSHKRHKRLVANSPGSPETQDSACLGDPAYPGSGGSAADGISPPVSTFVSPGAKWIPKDMQCRMQRAPAARCRSLLLIGPHSLKGPGEQCQGTRSPAG